MTGTVRYLDLPAQLAPLAAELEAGFAAAVRDGAFIGGPAVARFETAFASYCQARHCVGVASGTDALILALRVLDVEPGDVVLVPAATFIATAAAVCLVGAIPRFVDIDPETYTLSIEALRGADLTGAKAVIPVHLYGQPADMAPILTFASDHGLKVIEDAAQAHGARYGDRPVGSLGDLAAFSFYPGKNLGALGDAGAVVGDDEALVQRLRRLADHGRVTRMEHGEVGMNSRLDAIQAMALFIKLEHLGSWNAARARVAAWYDERLVDLPGVVTPKRAPERTHVFHIYCLQVDERDALVERLDRAGIQSGVHYPVAVHRQPAFADLGYAAGSMPAAEALAARCLSLPIYPELGEPEVERVAQVVTEHVTAGR